MRRRSSWLFLPVLASAAGTPAAHIFNAVLNVPVK